MGKQKPSDSKGPVSGFPYHLLWEDFGPEWEGLLENDFGSPLPAIEKLAAKLDPADAIRKRLDRQWIADRVVPFRAHLDGPEELIERLHQLAAIYLLTTIQRQLKLTPQEVRRAVHAIQRHSRGLQAAFTQLDDSMTRIMLGNAQVLRREANGWSAGERNADETLADLGRDLTDLAEGARLFALEMPAYVKGKNADVMTRRLIRDAAREIINAGLGNITIVQRGPKGKTYPPESRSARLLDHFVHGVNPGVPARTIFNVVRDHGLLTARRGPMRPAD